MSEDTVLQETKRPSIGNGQELPDDFWAKFEPPKKATPQESAKVLAFPKK